MLIQFDTPGSDSRPRGRHTEGSSRAQHQLTTTQRRDMRRLALAAAAISVAATIWSYWSGTILAYGDAESHVNIAKRVVGGVDPGLAQLGGVWLPLHHLLMVPFVWSDWLWRSGLAGSLVSMAAFVGSVLYQYRLVLLLSRNRGVAWLGAAFLGLNAGVLYMQTTPMSELPLIFALLGSIYHMSAWLRSHSTTQLMLASLLVAAGTLVRYDAWALVVAELAVIAIVARASRWRFSQFEGTSILYLTLGVVGIAGWLAWCTAIFSDPLYFMNSPFSAKAQQEEFAARGELPARHDLGTALLYFGDTAWRNAGTIVTVLSVLGLVTWTVRTVHARRMVEDLLPVLLLLVPAAFNVVSLFAGISILFVPDLTPSSFSGQLFNARYGLMAVPAMAALSALLVAAVLHRLDRRHAVLAAGAGLCVFVATMFSSTPIALQDGREGMSARRPLAVNAYVAEHYDHGMLVADDFSRSTKPTALDVPMNRIIYVGDQAEYRRAVDQPSSIVRWIVVQKNESDAYWRAVKDNPDFRDNFEQVYASGDSAVFRLED